MQRYCKYCMIHHGVYESCKAKADPTPESEALPAVRSGGWLCRSHANTYSRLSSAIAQTQCAHYALEEAEYASALRYIAEAEGELAAARKAIEPELRQSVKAHESQEAH